MCQPSVCPGGLVFAFYLLLPALISADPTGLTTSPTRGRLHCYTCSFAKPCYPVLTECREDEVCGVSVGTSGRTLVVWPFLGVAPQLSLFCCSCRPNLSSFVPQSKTRMSSSGKAASQEPSALCWAILPTGHGPTLSSTSAVSRICATLLPHSDPPAFPS